MLAPSTNDTERFALASLASRNRISLNYEYGSHLRIYDMLQKKTSHTP